MSICMELRIPLFLVGKPGSSKTLAKTVVVDVMQGTFTYDHSKHFDICLPCQYNLIHATSMKTPLIPFFNSYMLVDVI